MVRITGLSALLGVILSGCIIPADEPPLPGSECGIADDQAKAFMPRMEWAGVTEVYIDPSFRKGNEGYDASIEAALASWNQVGINARGRDFFRYSYLPLTRADAPQKEEDCSFENGGRNVIRIIREDSAAQWTQMGQDTSVTGLTLRCYSEKKLTKQVILLNTANAKSADSGLRQFTGIVLHEVGHSLGLDHSCEFKSTDSGYAKCEGLGNLHPYFQAILYPIFPAVNSRSSTRDVKQSLRKNDMDRAYCLYKGL